MWIFQGFWSEFWWPALLSNNSDDYWVLQELNDRGILVKFFQYLMRSLQEILKNSPRIWSEFFSRIRWPRNCFGILQGFRSEFWWPVLLSNNLDDHRILVKLVLDLIRILQELDDHGNNITIFNDFDQNSGSQPYYATIQMAIEF